MGERTLIRHLAAVLAADVVGYSRLMGADEVDTMTRLKAIHTNVLDPLIRTHDGEVVNSAGDSLIATFGSANAAVACAVRLQEILAHSDSDVGDERRMLLRVGVNVGDLIYDGEAFQGDGINIAARLESLAEPGGVLVADEVYRLIGGELRERFSDLGPQQLKNIVRPVQVWHWHPEGRSCTTAIAQAALKPTIAVLPFDNLSREARWDRLCDGLCEDIITDLARYPDLLVIARNSCFAYKGQSGDVRAVGRALGARYVLEGSIQADGSRIRLTAQLIDATSGGHVWGNRYDRDEADLFAIQDEVVLHVVAAIAGFGGAIPRAEIMRARRKPPASLHAYELYLLGYEHETRFDREGTLDSIRVLEAALQADPQLSRAWTVLGWAYAAAANNGWALDPVAARARRREAILRAAELDPGDGIALEELGCLQAQEGDIAGARETFERALAVAANHADALALLAKYVAAVLGRENEAMTLMQRALRLNPHTPPWYYFNLVRVAYFAHEFELALDAAARAPPLRETLLFRVLALAQLGRTAEAVAATEELRKAYPSFRPGEHPAELVERFPLVHPPARELFLDGARKAHLIV
jgi:adenylate cyclase